MPAKSKAQQQAAGMALAAKRGEIPVSDLQGSAKEMYDNMSEKQLRDFAKTDHENLPDKIAEELQRMKDLCKIEEMSIKHLKWSWDDDGQPTKQEIDISAREFAKKVIIDRLDQTGYWPESFSDEHEKMTDKERKSVNQHIEKFETRIYKMLKPKV